MKINIYTMLKTLLFTIQNGKNLSSGMQLLAKTAKTTKEKKVYANIYADLTTGTLFSEALRKNKLGSLDIIQFISMAEKGTDFKIALEKVIKYLEVKDEYERESNQQTTLPFIYFMLASIIILGVKFIAVPYQMKEAQGYSKEIITLISNHLSTAQFMTNILFVLLVILGSYFILLLVALFSNDHTTQTIAKKLGLFLPFVSKIIKIFEKFILFSMIGEMIQSGISFKVSMESAFNTTTVKKYKKALKNSLDRAKHDGKLIFDAVLYDDMERGLLVGVGSSRQVGKIMLEISSKAKSDALKYSTKFFRMITVMSIFLMAFAVFIEYYTVVLTQILIQKGLIDLVKGTGTY